MSDHFSFSRLTEVPTSPNDVLYPNLDRTFYAECKKNFDGLLHSIQRQSNRPTTFFVGAGISIFQPSQMPAAKDVLRELFTYVSFLDKNLTKYISYILTEVENNKFLFMEIVFQHLFEIVGSNNFHSGEIFNSSNTHSFNINHKFLAHWLKEKRGMVITVNLDPLIEFAWESINVDPISQLNVISQPQHYENWGKLLKSPNLWKLHGSTNDPQSWAITLGSVASIISDERASFLDNVLKNHDVCFIGYRAADLDIQPVIRKALDSPRHNDIYWVFYGNENKLELEDYLQDEPGAKELFSLAIPPKPIVSSAERIFSYLIEMEFDESVDLSGPSSSESVSFEGLRKDLHSAGIYGRAKLIGFALRSINKLEESTQTLEAAADHAISRGSQLLEEAALSFWQMGEYQKARSRIKAANELRQGTSDSLGLLWTEYGLMTMARTGSSVSVLRNAASLISSLFLQRKFEAHGNYVPRNFGSTSLGIGLCILHRAKIFFHLAEKINLSRNNNIRHLLLEKFSEARKFIRSADQHGPSLVDADLWLGLMLYGENNIESRKHLLSAMKLAIVLGETYRDHVNKTIAQYTDIIDLES